MRIHRRSAQPGFRDNQRSQADEWIHARKRFVPILWIVTACAVLSILVWLGHGLQVRSVATLLPKGWFPGTRGYANGLSTMQVEMEPAAYRSLSEQRSSALQRGILPFSTVWQPARAQFDDQPVSIRLRLAGDSSDHWQAQKWSLDVELESGAEPLGMTAFYLWSPANRGYLDRWLYALDLDRAGILVPHYTFVNLSVNGSEWGVYALEERISSEFLAARGLDAAVVVGLDSGPFSTQPLVYPFDVPLLAEIYGFDPSGDPLSGKHLAAARELLWAFQNGDLGATEVFDAELVGRFLAHADLWGVERDALWPSGTFYYSPLTARLEPLGLGTPSSASVDTSLEQGWLDDLFIAESYTKELLDIARPTYLEALQNASAATFERYHAALAQEFFPALLDPVWQTIAERQAALSNMLRPSQTVRAVQVQAAPHLVAIRVANILRYPVALDKLRVDEYTLDVQIDWLSANDRARIHPEAVPVVVLRSAQAPVPQYVTLYIPRSEIGSPAGDLSFETLALVTHLIGAEEQVTVTVPPQRSVHFSATDLPQQPSRQEVLNRHPFLTETKDPAFLALRPGTWHVDGDLVLPKSVGLRATQPVTLTFDREAGLFATGPLLLHAPDGEGIRLLPQGTEWGGIVVYRADTGTPSSLRNVEIRATGGLQRDKWSSAGGVTFYASPVLLFRCRLMGSTAQQAIRVEDAHFAFVHSEFASAAFDAFLGDAARGRIVQSAFHDILGNGIALSESTITVESTSMLRIYGAGIYADNGTAVIVRGARAEDVGVVAVSKDTSAVDIRDVRIAQAWVAGFAAYVEDLRDSTARISAAQVTLVDDSVPALVRGGGSVHLDRSLGPVDVGTLDLDVFNQRSQAKVAMRIVHYAFDPDVRLVGYKLLTTNFAPGETVELLLNWHAQKKLNHDYTTFVHVLDESGNIVAQWDAMPRANTFRTTAWPVGEIVDDVFRVPLPADMPSGEYQIALGMYDGQTGTRMPVRGPDGEAVADAAVLIEPPVRVN